MHCVSTGRISTQLPIPAETAFALAQKPELFKFVVASHLGKNEIYTNEHSGPVRTRNHRLTFGSISPSSCRYTDEIETDPGLRGLGTRLFALLMFRHRHRRWMLLARLLA
jgi:hypothetical protein